MKDIIIGADLDLVVQNGDFVIGNSTEQNKALILAAHQGEFRQNTVVGVGIRSYLNDDSGSPLSAIQLQFELDGMTVRRLELVNGNLINEAQYE